MKAGAVIVDLSAEGGGNCEDTEPGETTEVGGVTIVAPLNVPSLLGEDASELYAKNQYALLALMMKDNIITIDWTDEVIAKTALTHDGKLCDADAKPDDAAKAAANRPRKRPENDRSTTMNFDIAMTGFVALYIFMLAAFAGWVIIGNVPAILHTPLMSGSNFVHGIVVVGGLFALLNASTPLEQAIGFFAVLLGAGNAAGGYAVTDRMLAMFKTSDAKPKPPHASRHGPSPEEKLRASSWSAAFAGPNSAPIIRLGRLISAHTPRKWLGAKITAGKRMERNSRDREAGGNESGISSVEGLLAAPSAEVSRQRHTPRRRTGAVNLLTTNCTDAKGLDNAKAIA